MLLLAPLLYGQCAVEINADQVVSGCFITEKKITWTEIVNCTVSGTTLTKTGNGWNGGGASTRTLNEGNYMYTVAQQTNRYRMIGLSNTNTNAHYNTIDFAIYLAGNARIYVYESGTYRGNFGVYSIGDTLKITTDDNIVRYYRNSVLFYTSTVTPTFPLVVDASIYSNTGTLDEVTISVPADGNFTCTSTNTGTSPNYQWKLNGSNVGSNSATYNNSSLADNDVINCEVTPTDGPCNGVTHTSNTLTIEGSDGNNISATITAPNISAGCYVAEKEITWKDVTANCSANGNNLTRTSGNGWNGAAISIDSVYEGNYMYTIANETNTYRMIGLSTDNTNNSYTTIDFAIYLRSGTEIRVYESGTYRGVYGNYATGDTLKIETTGGVIKYYKNNQLFYTSTVTPTFPLVVDASIYSNGGTLEQVTIGGAADGNFNCNATNAGTNPTYQWKLNGTNVGTNSASYFNNSLSSGDTIICEVTPDLPNCSGTAVTSNRITIVEQPTNNLTASIDMGPSSTACFSAEKKITWTDVVKGTANGNNLTRSGTNGWNGGGASVDSIYEENYMYTVVNETNTNRMIGLSNTNANANYNTIRYALYLRSNGTIRIYESGTYRGDFGSYVAGDTLTIHTENSIIKYYNNDLLLYTSTVIPSFPMVVDASINTTGGTLEEVTIGSATVGNFICNVTNAGSNPTFQWKINGSNVGSNSATYTNNNLMDNDVVSCIVTPDISNCINAPLTPNGITVNEEITPDLVTSISTTPVTNGCFLSELDISWTNTINSSASGNSLTKTSGGNSWNAGGRSVDSLYEGSYMYTIAQQTNAYQMIGLSDNDVNANYNTIDFAIYLAGNSNVYVYESGTYRGNFGTYTIGDTLRIDTDSGVVKYYKGNTLLYTSTVTPSFPMIIDASINTNNSTLANVVIGTSTDGNFTCNAGNAGANPTFQWKLNGTNVGSNSNSYSSSSLSENDIITCDVTPDIANCGSLEISSKQLKIISRTVEITWNGSIDNNWNDIGNWDGPIPDSMSNVVIPSGATITISNDASCKSITIANGGSLEITGTNTLEVYGNWNNSGTFVANQSTVTFSKGSYACSISGGTTLDNTSPQTFYNLEINNIDGVTMSGDSIKIRNTLSLEDGSFATNNKLLLLSDANGTARVTEIKNGTITGNVEVQRYIDAGATNWRFLTFPVSGQNLESFDDDFITSGFPGTDWPDWPTAANPWSSFYFYDESIGTTMEEGFYVPSSTSDVVGVGQGIWIWCGDTITGTQPFTIDVNGPINQGTINLPVTYTNSAGDVTIDGWNMVANPYPCTIDWDASDWTKTNIDDAIYIWNPENAQFASYVSGVGVNLGSNKIASSQAFWVHANGSSPQLTITEKCKENNDHSFLKKDKSLPKLLRLQLNTDGTPITDETVIRFEADATPAFDDEFDAVKFVSNDIYSPRLSTIMADSTEFAINTIATSGFESVLVNVVLYAADSCTIRTTDISGIMDMGCVLLEDLELGIYINLLTDSLYRFYQEENATAPRFKLHLSPTPQFTHTDISCFAGNDGSINANYNLGHPAHYIWTNQAGDTLQDNIGFNDVKNDLTAGIYFIHYSDTSSKCPSYSDSVTLIAPMPIAGNIDVVPASCETCCDGEATITISGGTPPYYYSWNDLHEQDQAIAADLCSDNYEVIITDHNGCDTSFSSFVAFLPSTSVEDIVDYKDRIKIYPNPMTDVLIIESNEAIDEIGLWSVDGKRLNDKIMLIEQTSSKIIMQTSGLPKGTYIVKLKNSTHKILKN